MCVKIKLNTVCTNKDKYYLRMKKMSSFLVTLLLMIEVEVLMLTSHVVRLLLVSPLLLKDAVMLTHQDKACLRSRHGQCSHKSCSLHSTLFLT